MQRATTQIIIKTQKEREEETGKNMSSIQSMTEGVCEFPDMRTRHCSMYNRESEEWCGVQEGEGE